MFKLSYIITNTSRLNTMMMDSKLTSIMDMVKVSCHGYKFNVGLGVYRAMTNEILYNLLYDTCYW